MILNVVTEGPRVRKTKSDFIWWPKGPRGQKSTALHPEEPEVLVDSIKDII